MPTTSPPSPSKGKSKQEIRNPRRLLILSPSSHPHSDSLIPSLLKTLTGHPPAETQTQTQSFAGYTTHPPLRIENRYYAAEVPIWVDEIRVQGGGGSQAGVKLGSEAGTETGSGLRPGNSAGEGEDIPSTQWAREFSSPEARVVRDAIGAVMICIRNPSPGLDPRSFGVVSGTGTGAGTEAEGIDDEDREEVRALKAFVRAVGGVRALIEEERGEIGAVPGLLVLGSKGKQEKRKQQKKGGLGEEDLDLESAGLDGGLDEPFSIGWWEDQLCEMGLIGFEVVEWDGRPLEQEGEKRNEYGELQGMRRVKEVLETHEWVGDEEADTGLPDDDDLERQLLGLDEGSGFNKEVDELEREMVGLRFAIGRGGDGDEDEDDEGDEEIRVDAVEALLMRMRAIKDMSDELPENDRKRFAAKAVRDIMKDI
ncbi:alpha and gamma adaptin binding protein p34-domain-containing protein [Aspergillus aurantiobrunneus]